MRLTLSDAEVKLYSKMNRLCCKAIILERRLNDLLINDEIVPMIQLQELQLEVDETLKEIKQVKDELHAIQALD